MKLKLSALLLAGGFLASASAFAQSADDKKWINQCLSDNKDAKVAAWDARAARSSCVNSGLGTYSPPSNQAGSRSRVSGTAGSDAS